jgi:uncharacterized coiled-coil DUF342 family protein
MEEADKAFAEFENKRKEISELKAALNTLNDQKERLFDEKERYSREIKDLIRKVKALKDKRNDFTKLVKEDKDKKTDLEGNIEGKIAEVKKLRTELDEIRKKYNLQGDPFSIKREMARLERTIETEAISFDKEQKLMKRIKELKHKLEDYAVVSDTWKKIKQFSDEIDKLKGAKESYHSQVQDNAKKSQSEHEQMLTYSQKIDELKVKEEETYKKFIEAKEKFNEANKALKEKLPDMNDAKDKLDTYHTKAKNEKQHKEKLTLKEKADLARKKLTSGEKLTTEDLLALQSMDD